MDHRYDILLIEDSPSQALRTKLILQQAGYNVQVAPDGLQGWRHARLHAPRLVLLDVDLPKLNGFQVLNNLKQNRVTRTIPVVMLTDHDRLNDVEQALELGADDYLPKQDALEQLCAVVHQILGVQTIVA
jgi:DNA-binding response OmpR family regulator